MIPESWLRTYVVRILNIQTDKPTTLRVLTFGKDAVYLSGILG
jgi:hypothetical protein